MSNSYFQFSEIIGNIPDEALPWIRSVLNDPDDMEDDEITALRDTLNVKEAFDFEGWPNFGWEIKSVGRHNLWVYSEENYDENHLVAFVQALFSRFLPDALLLVTSGGTCDKLHPGEFGGAWLAINAEEVRGGNTWDAAKAAADSILQDKASGEDSRLDDLLSGKKLWNVNDPPQVRIPLLRQLHKEMRAEHAVLIETEPQDRFHACVLLGATNMIGALIDHKDEE